MTNSKWLGEIKENKLGYKAKVIGLSTSKETSRGHPYLILKFLESGYVSECDPSNFSNGVFKDYGRPTVYGVGYTFEGASSKYRKLYKIWSRMLERCYTNKEKRIQKWYKDVIVCDRWHHFRNFLKDAKELEGYKEFEREPNKYSLDKDIKGNGKIYSKETCMFVTQREQMTKAVGKPVISISSNGDRVFHTTINEACRKLGVQNANVYKVLKGERKTTLGYKFERP